MRSKRGKRRKPMNTSNKVLVLLGIGVCTFIIAMIVTYWITGGVPDSLIDKVLDFGQWEAGFLAAIKIAKTLKGKTEEES